MSYRAPDGHLARLHGGHAGLQRLARVHCPRNSAALIPTHQSRRSDCVHKQDRRQSPLLPDQLLAPAVSQRMLGMVIDPSNCAAGRGDGAGAEANCSAS
jgi:hypothetical protein